MGRSAWPYGLTCSEDPSADQVRPHLVCYPACYFIIIIIIKDASADDSASAVCSSLGQFTYCIALFKVPAKFHFEHSAMNRE